MPATRDPVLGAGIAPGAGAGKHRKPPMSDKMIELLILFAIAAFVLFKLRSVIGTRTGYEAPPDYLSRGNAPRGMPDRGAPETPAGPLDVDDEAEPGRPLSGEVAAALATIRRAEPDFSLPQFLSGARQAYEMILMAYEAGDRGTLRNLLAPDVYAAFDQVIAERETKGLRVEARFVGVRDLRLEHAEFDPDTGEADLTLRIVGEMITAVRDAENRIVEGDPNEVRRQTDVWTFSRSMGARDPNWLLSATGA
jgi:predicted lipid-binding transport protein (Tim44 family)